MQNTQTTITFSSETSGVGGAGESIQVRMDETANGGKTSFLYGDKAFFQLYTYPENMTLTITPSDGSVSDEGSGVGELEEIITFANTDEASVAYPLASIVSTEWLGRSLGAITKGESAQIKAAQKGVGVLRIKYKANFIRKALTLGFKDEASYPVIVHILGGTA